MTTLLDHLQKTRCCSLPTAKATLSKVKKISGIEELNPTLETYRTWLNKTNINDILSSIDSLKSKNGGDLSKETKNKYYQAIITSMSWWEHEGKPINLQKKGGVSPTSHILDGCIELHTSINEIFSPLNQECIDFRKSGEKSVKQNKLWCEWKEIIKMAKRPIQELNRLGVKLGKTPNDCGISDNPTIKNKQLNAIQDVILSHLYVGSGEPPRRSEFVGHVDRHGDFKETKYGGIVCGEDTTGLLYPGETDNNLLIERKESKKRKYGTWEFHLFNHKNSHTEGTYIHKITDPKMIKLILLFKFQSGTDHVFSNRKLKDSVPPMTPNNLSKNLARIFDIGGIGLSIDMLRTIHKTTFCKDAKEKLEEHAKKSGHSVAMGNTYIKE